jgi:TolB-like protein/Flp pilus assembly protein TadD/predicted Ser/Thr protein kinase
MIGKTVSHYKILEKLGEGGMGVVYKAEDTKLKRTVALKFLSERALASGEEKERFVHEARAAAALDHTGICTVHEIGSAEGRMFITMAYVEGRSLKEKIVSGPLATEEAIGIALQLAEALKEAHEKGIAHRDIKPGNIIVTSKGGAKILDFGLAKSAAGTTVTRDGTTLGTFAYMSPEQTRGEEIDGRTDIWSLGVVLYEMLTGQRPFKGDYEQAVVYSILNTEPEPVTALRAELPAAIDGIIEKALAKEPEERYRSMTEMAAELRSVARRLEAGDDETVSGSTTKSAAGKPTVGRPAKRRKGRLYIYGSLVVIAAAVLVVRLTMMPRESEAIDSIAVLPLDNLSGDPDQEYFADGMTDELISNLARLSALRVISRTSAMRYKDTNKTLPQIARELNVDAVVEGSVLRSGDRVRINTQLIHASSDKQLWGDSFERDLSDVLSLQREVAQSIARKIEVALTPEENARLAAAATVNPAAHQAYLRGRYNLNTLKVAAHEKAIELFRQAIEEDPTFALAYAGLGEAYDALACFGSIPPRDAWPRVRTEALRALKHDEGLAEAHALLADVKFLYEWDWRGAELEYKRAIELSPGYADAYSWYSLYLSSVGRHEEAVAEARKAVELDPLSVGSHMNLGGVLANARRYDESIEEMKGAHDLAHDSFLPNYHLAIVYCFNGMLEEARSVIERAETTPDPDVGAMAEVFAMLGETDRARGLLDDLLAQSKSTYVPALDVACVYAALGEREPFFEWMEAAYDERSTWLVDAKVDPKFDGMRPDPRFSSLLREMGLEPDRADAEESPAAGRPTAEGRIRVPTAESASRGPDKSIVVLPFNDISPGGDNEYFSDGLTEEIIADLSKVRTLRVISRTSAMTLKGTNMDIREIGRKLDVRYVLEGSVRKAGEDLRITAQLIDATNDAHIWAEKYSGTLEDVFDMQEKVSRAIVDALKLELSPKEDRTIGRRPIDNVRAYEYYLKARREIWLFSEDGLGRALQYLQKGLDIVGDNPLLYAGMGYVHWQYVNAGISTDSAHLDAVEKYAEKCFEMDPDSSHGHLLLGVLEHARGNQRESIRHLRLALSKDPNDSEAIHWLAVTYSFVGKTSEASEMAELCRVIDPFLTWDILSWVSLLEGRLGDAEEYALEAYENNPDNATMGQWYGLMLAHNGRFTEASALTDRTTRDSRESYMARLYLFMKNAWEGNSAEAEDIMTPDFEAKTKRDIQYSWLVAGGCALLGEKEKALDWLENSVNLGFINYPYLSEHDPFLESLRGEKRFEELMERVKYEWESFDE